MIKGNYTGECTEDEDPSWSIIITCHEGTPNCLKHIYFELQDTDYDQEKYDPCDSQLVLTWDPVRFQMPV